MHTNPRAHLPKPHRPGILSWLKLVFAGLLLTTLAACAENFDSKVTRFQSALPPPQGQHFAIVADDPALQGGIEFGQYARLVAGHLIQAGYTEVATPAQADMVVRFDYGVDKGHERIQSTGFARDPFWGPWYGWAPVGRWGRSYGGFYGGGYGRGFAGHGAWGFGWYDPWFDNDIESYTVYQSGVSLKIDRTGDGKRLFEGKATAASTSNRLSYLVPNLVEALFTGFPGNSGETVRISIAPEKQVAKRPSH
jgi:hypothetical protein